MYKDEQYEKLWQQSTERVNKFLKQIEDNPENAQALYELSVCYKDGLGVIADDEMTFKYAMASYNIDHNPLAARIVGLCYYSGRYVKADIQQGLALYRYAHQYGEKTATASLLVHDLYTLDKESYEWQNAYHALQATADEGNPFAQYAFAALHDNGMMGEEYGIAFQYYLEAIKNGHALACVQLGYMYSQAIVDADDIMEKSAYYFRLAAYMHNAHGMYNLGSAYQTGRGIEKDEEAAVYWFQNAANRGQANALMPLYFYYKEGIYLPQDENYAKELLHNAAVSGIETAQLEYGNILSEEGPDCNYKEALYWFQQAAEQGNVTAVNNIGWLYENGYGVPQDYAEAIRYFYQAAEGGYAVAQCNVGRYYLEEIGGMPNDPEEAKKWLRLSADQGYQEAVDLLKDAEKIQSQNGGFWKGLFSK